MTARSDHPIVAVFGSSLVMPGEAAYAEAETCGRLLAESGYTVATGGYGGSMEAASRGAALAGGHVIGVTAPTVFSDRGGPNRWVAEEQPASSLTERIHRLAGGSDAAIALPGSLGTFAELTVFWYAAYTASLHDIPAPPIITIGAKWASLVGQLAEALEVSDHTIICVHGAEAAVAEVRRRIPASRRQAPGS